MGSTFHQALDLGDSAAQAPAKFVGIAGEVGDPLLSLMEPGSQAIALLAQDLVVAGQCIMGGSIDGVEAARGTRGGCGDLVGQPRERLVQSRLGGIE
jgi:hypothetical protein